MAVQGRIVMVEFMTALVGFGVIGLSFYRLILML